MGHNAAMRVSAKVDYALRAAIELAARESDWPVTGETIAKAQDIPLRFLENILLELRRSGIVDSRRGPEGGYLLAMAPAEIDLASVIRAIDGPLAGVGGKRPETLEFTGTAEPLKDVWIAVRASLRGLLEHVTLADVVAGRLPANVGALTKDPDAWLAGAARAQR
jgi:Rrf2 family protein